MPPFFRVIHISNQLPQKAACRSYFRKIRDDYRFLAPEILSVYDHLICTNLVTHLKTLKLQNIALYWPLGSEVDLRPAVLDLSIDYNILIPYVHERDQPLQFHPFHPTSYREDALGHVLPISDSNTVPDLIVIPLVCVSLDGTRIGYGGGYYDRTLANIDNIQTIGVGFSFQVCNTFNRDHFDLTLDSFISEKGIITFKGK